MLVILANLGLVAGPGEEVAGQVLAPLDLILGLADQLQLAVHALLQPAHLGVPARASRDHAHLDGVLSGRARTEPDKIFMERSS